MTFTRRVSSCFSQFLGFANRSFNSYKLPGDPSSSPSLTYGIHIFHCPDEVGIVAKLSERIASRGGNILGADVFVPQNKNVFYSRSEFVFDPVRWPRKQMDEDFLKLSNMFSAIRSVARVPALDPKFKIAVLASKQDHCLVDLLYGWQEGRLPVDITCVIRYYINRSSLSFETYSSSVFENSDFSVYQLYGSNHHRGPNNNVMHFLERNGIPYHYLHTTEENKREREILELVLNTDFLVLARYMQ
ncbi:hypothetical protein Goari_020245, partial [Gossypium aridum]|nr:hypothetical protein [Gossypium aridum]